MIEWSLVVSKEKQSKTRLQVEKTNLCAPRISAVPSINTKKTKTNWHRLYPWNSDLENLFQIGSSKSKLQYIFTHHLWNHQKPWVSQWHVDVFPSKGHFVLLVEHIDSWWVLDHVLNPQRTSWHLGNLTSPANCEGEHTGPINGCFLVPPTRW